MKKLLILILLFSNVALSATPDLIGLEEERKWALATDLTEVEIAQVVNWMSNSKQELEDLLKLASNEDTMVGKLSLLTRGLNKVMEKSFPINTELQMRVVLHRALSLSSIVEAESKSAEGSVFMATRSNVKLLVAATKESLRYYQSDLAYLEGKESERDMAKFGVEAYSFFMDQAKKIFDISAQYNFIYNIMGFLKVDLFRSENNKVPGIARIISQLDRTLEYAPKNPATDSEARDGLRKLLVGNAEMDFSQIKKVRVEQSKSGTRRNSSSFTADFVTISAGTFTMGSPRGEINRFRDEEQKEVTLTKDFEMMTTEVTQEMYFNVMKLDPSNFSSETNCPGSFDQEKGICPNNPVEQVNWNEVQDFISKLNSAEGLNCGDQKTAEGFKIAWQTPGCYRLPTEAEWEYAARAGSRTAYSFGNSDAELSEYAFYKVNSESKSHPVASKRANSWGLYDMHGNVYEWVQDWYTESAAGGVDPVSLQAGSYRSLRGGSWNNDARYLRSADRGNWDPPGRFSNMGFRLARTLH